MKFLLTIEFPTSEANKKAKDGSILPSIKKIINDINPETVYFGGIDGSRACYMIVNLEKNEETVMVCEPWYMLFNAKVDIKPVMSLDDLENAAKYIV